MCCMSAEAVELCTIAASFAALWLGNTVQADHFDSLFSNKNYQSKEHHLYCTYFLPNTTVHVRFGF